MTGKKETDTTSPSPLERFFGRDIGEALGKKKTTLLETVLIERLRLKGGEITIKEYQESVNPIYEENEELIEEDDKLNSLLREIVKKTEGGRGIYRRQR